MSNNNKLDKILADKISGSEQILSAILNYLLDISDNNEQFKSALKIIKAELSHFTAVNNFINWLEKNIISCGPPELKKFLVKFKSNSENKYQGIYTSAKPYLKNIKTVLTLSNSKTILEVFKLWAKNNNRLHVIICESRPQFEGRILAKYLLKENIKVDIITDAMMSLYIPKADAVIIGADSIHANGNVINKTGSLSVALLCRYYKKPCYVMASKDKFSIKNKFKQKEQPKEEIWKFQNKKLNISNFYFEEVPAKLISEIFF